jgi:hypothetical protein
MIPKYIYLGNIEPSIPKYWENIVYNMIKDIDKLSRPWFIPRFFLDFLKYKAMGNSIYTIKNKFWYNVFININRGACIHVIKQKYGELCVYGDFSDNILEIIEFASEECSKICEQCGSKINVKKCVSPGGVQIYNFCSDCRFETDKINL